MSNDPNEIMESDYKWFFGMLVGMVAIFAVWMGAYLM